MLGKDRKQYKERILQPYWNLCFGGILGLRPEVQQFNPNADGTVNIFLYLRPYQQNDRWLVGAKGEVKSGSGWIYTNTWDEIQDIPVQVLYAFEMLASGHSGVIEYEVLEEKLSDNFCPHKWIKVNLIGFSPARKNESNYLKTLVQQLDGYLAIARNVIPELPAPAH